MSEKSIVKQLEQLKVALKKPAKPVPQQPEEDEMATKKKVVKKVTKKSVAKASKADGNSVTLADLAKEADITPQRARQKLRAAEIERDGRWKWEAGSSALKAVRKALDLK